MVLKRQLIRFAGGVGLLAALGFAALFGFAQDEKWWNPLLPKSSWPTLEAAATDDSGPVQVLVAGDVSVNSFEEGIQYCYCDFTADPLNPNRLFASSLVETPKARVPGSNAKLSNVAGFYSHDGGKSWTRAFYLVADTGNQDASQRESYSDSTVCWGRDGAVHFAVMHGKGFEPFVPKKAGDKPPRKDHRIDFWKSEDAGVSWKQGSGIPFFLDRPFTVVDTTSSPRSGRLYTIANDSSLQIFANEATDLKSRQVEIHEQHFVNARPANPVILRDGTVLFAAEEYNPMWLGRVQPGAARQISTFRCSDGEHVVTGSPINTRWSHDSLDNSGRPLFSFFPRLGANSDSRKFIDHVYCVWAGNRIMPDGSRLPEGERVFLSVSRDGGQVWDQPVSLSEQPLGSNPDEDFLTALPTVAVNRDGIVAVSWYDRRGLPKSDSRLMFEGWNVRARISVDGGTSWLPSVQLNQRPSQGEFDVGHTQGLTAAADGRFHALWIDSRDGTRQLRTTAFGIK